jgi:amino acid transporter
MSLPVVATAAAAAAGFAAGATPLAFVVAGAGCLCLASVMVRLTKRMASAGGVYTFIARGLSPNGGFLGGWLYGAGFAVSLSIVLSIGASALSQLVSSRTDWSPGWFASFLFLLAAVLAFAFLGIRVSTRTTLVLASACLIAVLVLAIVVLAEGGEDGITLEPLDPRNLPSTQGLFLAAAFAFAAFIGYDAAAVLGEETSVPREAIPRAILTAAMVVVGFAVFLSWTMVLGFGIDNSAGWAGEIAPLDALASSYAGPWLVVLVDLAVVVATFLSALGVTHVAARVFFAMGREGGLPRAFAWTHPRFQTPWLGTAVVLTLALVLVTVLGRSWTKPSPSPFPFVQFMALTATLCILATYILVAVSGMVVFLRTRGGSVAFNVALDVVLPLGGIAICGYTIFESVHPLPPAPAKYGPWVALAWLLVGLAIHVRRNLTKPQRVREFGSILGEAESRSSPG